MLRIGAFARRQWVAHAPVVTRSPPAHRTIRD
jgi:hypothetical protein